MERYTTMKSGSEIDVNKRIYALQHIENGEFICLLQDGDDYLACFSDGDTALQFRADLGLQEHVDLTRTTMGSSPFHHFWLDGENLETAHELAR